MKTLDHITTLGQLLRLSLEDAKTVKANGVILDMNTWVDSCSVCMAGAVMMNSLEFDGFPTPCRYEAGTRRKLFVIDEVRRGNYTGASGVFSFDKAVMKPLYGKFNGFDIESGELEEWEKLVTAIEELGI